MHQTLLEPSPHKDKIAMQSHISHEKLLAGDRRCLSKVLTLLESSHPQHRSQFESLLDAIMPFTGNSLRIGISGTPGVGKSSFTEALALEAIKHQKQVAVLAIDPSSPCNGGSILGDKQRMSQLAYHPQAFIRPSASHGHLGGVAEHTRESILVCEAAGYDLILVETIGVGQSEFEVSDMVDFFLLLLQPNSGDYIQGIKRGILELVDGIVVHKADGSQQQAAQVTQAFYQQSLSTLQHSAWNPDVLCCSSKEHINIDACWNMLQNFQNIMQHNQQLHQKRQQQTKNWVEKLLMKKIQQHLRENNPWVNNIVKHIDQHIATSPAPPNSLVEKLFSEYVNQNSAQK